jgi:hypothetical protein
MVRNWADHCSSDEESVGDDDGPPSQQFADQAQIHNGDDVYDDSNPNGLFTDMAQDAHDEDGRGATPATKPPKTYDYPSQPPFTAFVGGLSFSIKNNADFVAAMDDECRRRLSSSDGGGEIKFLGGRIAFSREDPTKHRGFGYLEVETLDQVRVWYIV